MSKTLRDILKIPECRCLQVVAGQNGLDRQVCWTAAIEVKDIIKFCNEGDLNFVTGLMIATDEDFIEFVREAYDQKMAGIVFAPGPYIQTIPLIVTEFANTHDFPIMTMPWNVKISTLSHIVGEYVSGVSDLARAPSDILKSVLLGMEEINSEAEIKAQLKSLGLSESSAYRVLIMRVISRSRLKPESLNEIYDKLTDIMRMMNFIKVPVVSMPSQVAVVLTDQESSRITDEKVITCFRNMVAKVQVQYDDIVIRIGIGNPYNKIAQLADSYNEAFLVTDLLPTAAQYRKELYRYDQLGAYKVIWDSRNPQAMIKFSGEILGPLETYDVVNKTDLIKFIGSYFEYNGNAREVSERLFLHKNTVRYKIGKVESILNRSFDDLQTILDLKLALMIREVFSPKD